MNKQSMTDLIVSTKASKGLTWETIGNDLKMSPVWLASACL
ncbi:MAG: cyanate hydratase, partial [Gammaproteobacteria bacterium]|nr:cyanate hydratase [Gammaproteobacteria bacterium]